MILHHPGGIAEGNQVVGFIEMAVEIEPAVLQGFAVKPENRHYHSPLVARRV
jgi:hypothetical protein